MLRNILFAWNYWYREKYFIFTYLEKYLVVWIIYQNLYLLINYINKFYARSVFVLI